MYTIKLKALILSIVFNYQRFLMKIDCTKCFVFLLLFFCLCMLLPEQMNFMDGTQSTHSSCSSSSGVKKKKNKENQRHCCSHCLLPIMNAQIKHL